jgi:hypothetical protein
MKQLNSQQRNELIEQYVEIVVDSLDHKDLIQIVSDSITDYMDSLSDSELKEEIDNRDDELYDELVDNVTQQYAKLPNTFGGQS